MECVNTVVPLERLEHETVTWAQEMLALSPFSLRLLRPPSTPRGRARGIQQLAHDATCSFYESEEAQEDETPTGRSASRTFRSSPGAPR